MASRNTGICLGCNKEFNLRGLPNHQKKCTRTASRRQQDLEFEANRQVPETIVPTHVLPKFNLIEAKPPSTSTSSALTLAPERHTLPQLGFSKPSRQGETSEGKVPSTTQVADVRLPRLKSAPVATGGLSQRVGSAATAGPDRVTAVTKGKENISNATNPSPTKPKQDDIRTTYHPASERATLIESFENYGLGKSVVPPSPPAMPWLPFNSESEFSFAEVVHESAISNKHIDALIRVVHKLLESKEVFRVQNHKELQNLWIGASDELAPFTLKTFDLDYRGNSRNFEFWSRSLMGWAVNVAEDQYLSNFIKWDAELLEKFNGTKWVRFVNEPWTAKRMWNVQSMLPKDGKPLCITLYADKTRLSSFGTAQGYPIMAQLNNLPQDIRNGKGLGSTQVVGWLPIVSEEESDKSDVVDFKRAVWHKSFELLLESISLFSVTGYLVKCGDGEWRRLFPFIFVLAADYEEQYVM